MNIEVVIFIVALRTSPFFIISLFIIICLIASARSQWKNDEEKRIKCKARKNVLNT